MDFSILAYGTAIWFLLLMLAMFNGLFRDQGYSRVVGELRAHQISTVIFCLIILGVTAAFLQFNQRGPYSTASLLLLGLWWAVLTTIFEFGFFHYVIKVPWETLRQNYNVREGRIFVLVLFTLALAPALLGMMLR